MAGPVSLLERPSVAIANLVRIRPVEGLKALFAPSYLSPDDTRTLGELIVDEKERSPIIAGLAETITDPLFLIGTALSFRYPVAKVKDLFSYAKKWGAYHRSLGAIESLVMRGESLFNGTPIPANLMNLEKATEGIQKKLFVDGFTYRAAGGKKKHVMGLAKILEEFTGKAGRPPTHKELLTLGAKLEGWDTKLPERFAKVWSKMGVKAPAFTRKIELTPDMQRLYNRFDEWRRMAYREVVEPFFKVDRATGKLVNPQGPRSVKIALGMSPGDDLAAHELRDYLYHIPQRSLKGELLYAGIMDDAARMSVDEFNNVARSSMGFRKGRALYRRTGVMVPNIEELSAVDGFNPEFGAQLTDAVSQYRQRFEAAKAPIAQMISGAENELSLSGLDSAIRTSLQRLGVSPKNVQGTIRKVISRAEGGNIEDALDSLDDLFGGTGDVATYSIDPVTSFNSYVLNISRPYAWSIPQKPGMKPIGRALKDAAEGLPTESADLFNDYIPVLQGMTNPRQTRHLLMWNGMRRKIVQRLTRDVGGLAKLIPENLRGRIVEAVSKHRGPFSYVNAMNATSSWFYYSTLWANPSSAFKNMLQTVITTVPTIGVKATMKGMQRAGGRLFGQNGYFSLRFRGVSDGEAMMKAFPEFSRTTLAETSLSQNILKGTLENAWRGAVNAMPETLRRTAGRGGAIPDKLKRVAMSLFSGTERWNRLVAFEGAMWKGGMEGMAGEQLIDAAAKVVRGTQFAAGLGQMPQMLFNVPGPLRQFMYFPMRYLGFLWESTRMPWGAGPMAKAYTEGARNWGTIGRTLAGSSAAYHGVKELLGMDLSQGLAFGALPLPQIPDSPFYPFPFVPPIASVAGLGIKGLATEDPTALQRMATLLTPGGVAGYRAFRSLYPKYAQWDQVGPDGKVPLLNDQGSLIARYSPMQLYMRALGLNPDSTQKEREMTGYLLKQRDQIRAYRREYVDAILDNETEKAEEIQESFQNDYPGLGPIQLKKSDLTAARKRREMVRLQRLLETMPKAYQPYFAEVISTYMGQQMGEMFGGANLDAVEQSVPTMQTIGEKGMGAFPWAQSMGAGGTMGGLGASGSFYGGAISPFSGGVSGPQLFRASPQM